ncbi:MAG TPA: arginine--tRNA ligase [Candidatus Kryptonia bacterium]|nr:arginine--tRNA ligase [Candidatus Kryptonia bacterium]
MKKRLEGLLQHALSQAIKGGALKSTSLPPLLFEVPKNAAFGDLASTVALALARAERRAPRQIAETIRDHFADPEGLLASVEIDGPGYLNFRFSQKFWISTLAALDLPDQTVQFANLGAGKRVQVEFVSANPTGPLTIGHGRNAVLGDAVARLLEATGHQVTREYYFNNAGRQMKLLGESLKARYLELLGEPLNLPEEGYQGQYIVDIARTLVDENGDRLRHEPSVDRFKDAAERAIMGDIERTLDRMDIHFDVYFNEDTLYRGGQIDEILQALRSRSLAFDHDGAVWLAGEPLGLDKDRVLVKSSGEPAYRLPDIAYHKEKLARGFELIIDVLGADHIAEHEEVRAAIKALGLDADRIKAIIYQFVTLTRGGEQVKMSTRRAEYVTVDELLDEVGRDVVRFFFLTRKADSHLEFDLDLAKKQSSDNPVFYVQYAHARICSLIKQAASTGVPLAAAAQSHLDTLTAAEEIAVVKLLARYHDTVEDAAHALEPHRVVFYLIDLASEFHRFYNHHRVLTEDRARTAARLFLARAVATVIRSGLTLVGVGAPETM